jgi:DNA-damage-inducible protein J
MYTCVKRGKIMPNTTSMVHVRIDNKVKKQASQALLEMGLSVSDAVRMMLVRVAKEKVLPFNVYAPNAETIAAMEEARKGGGKKFSSVEELLANLNEKD